MAAELKVRDQGSTRILSISNPPRKNAVDAGLLARLQDEAGRAATDGARALILCGEGVDFCAGYDLNAVEAWDPTDPSAELPDAPLSRACAALEAAPLPVIAAIQGAAMGAGFELACACDFRIAEEEAKLALPPAKLGLVYAPEGVARVLRTVGLAQARRFFLRAARVDGTEAVRVGLVDELADQPLKAALALADELAQLAPKSIAGMKRSLNELRPALDPKLLAELDGLRREAFASEDAREGLAAFLERRAPRWTGR
jgi:enoyl-CoA hydratase/carnithine racemase